MGAKGRSTFWVKTLRQNKDCFLFQVPPQSKALWASVTLCVAWNPVGVCFIGAVGTHFVPVVVSVVMSLSFVVVNGAIVFVL